MMQKKTKRYVLFGWIVWLAILLGMAFYARSWAMRELGTARATTEWSEWKDSVEREKNMRESGKATSPVLRRVPKSDEPPALVFLRDYFSTCIGGTIIFGSLLYFTGAFFIVGMLQKNSYE